MERRVLLAIVLSFVALYVSQAILTRFVPRTSTPSSAGSPATSASVAPPQAEKNPEAAAAAPAAASTATTLVGDASEREIRVENRDVIAVFTNRGARLKSWRLKHFLDGKGQPLDLVATDLATPQPLPFSLR